jgi:Polyketide cyclase / dehydrase and lipid transport
MGHLDLRFHVNAAVKRVCQLYACPELMPIWQKDMVRVEDLSGPLDRLGCSYSRIYRIGGGLRRARYEVTHMEPDRLLQHRGTTPRGGTFVATKTLDPGCDGTDVTWHMEYRLPGGVVGDLADRLIFARTFGDYVRASNERFRALAEDCERATT